MPRTFKHSGDLGDIIFGLPVIRAIGGGILFLDPAGGETEPLVTLPSRNHTRLNAASIESLATLLRLQPYIHEVRHWQGEPVDCNLDQFRAHMRYNNISDAHLAAFGLPLAQRDTPWITAPEPIIDSARPVVINRTVRYLSNYTFWEANLPSIANQCRFVGNEREHDIFEYTFETRVPLVSTPTILDLARVVAGATQFIGNASLPHALAEAMKKNVVVELYRVSPNVVFNRPGAIYV
jgi:hypothetical protein